MRICDILGNPELERASGMTKEKYQALVKQHGLDVARNTRIAVELEE
jgi:hypothetical protein